MAESESLFKIVSCVRTQIIIRRGSGAELVSPGIDSLSGPSQKNNGEKVHGIAAAHGPVAIDRGGVRARRNVGIIQVLGGSIPATLSDFKIDPPSLLAIPVKNEMPVRVDMTWRPQ
jgi:hypothetical protein